jgi:hypothetical protein
MRHAIDLLVALAATPAVACADWQAVAAFDAIITSNDVREMAFVKAFYQEPSKTRDEAIAKVVQIDHGHRAMVEVDRIHAVRGDCGE